jgi:asparagine synthase (glutamine-hydrolysing)
MVVLSNIVKKGKLVSFDDWFHYIDSLKTNKKITEEDKAVEILSKLFLGAVKKRIPEKKFGIFFSGGVDSTLIAFICKNLKEEFICYTVGIEGSQDIEFSEKVAKDLKLNHKKKVLTLKEIEEVFEKTAKILGKDLINIVNLGVGAVELAAIELAKKDNISIIFGGLGSEEIFAGYQRHENSEDINEECWSGLKTTWERDFQRDYAIAKATNTEFLTPFLDTDLIKTSLQISGELKIKEGYKKYILRQTALNLGLKNEFAFRPKKAAQYGSNFDKAIKKIAKAKGFRYKKEYLNYLSNNK